MLISLDIETACAVGCEEKCDHGLDAYRNRITVIGLFIQSPSGPISQVYRSVVALRNYLSSIGDYSLVGHNLKFDLKTLAAKGLDLSAHWVDDTQIMAATCMEKVSEEYLAWYETERKRLNASLPRGYSHRQASLHSLKTLAPYFLGVDPFWENPADHDNDEYVLKDCEYTYRLATFFREKLREEASLDFYKNKLMPWAKLLYRMERRGVAIDLDGIDEGDLLAKREAQACLEKLNTLWSDAYEKYRNIQLKDLRNEYDVKLSRASEKAKDKTKTAARYNALYEKAASKVPNTINLDSPAQLAWLLKDHLKLDIADFHGDESTGKPVLQKLAQDREDIKTFLEYRKQKKLTTAFFPSYREMHHDGVLHCSFNPTGARTGRLSSSGPNLQQVPGHLHRLFKARPGYKLATYDMSAIEPRLIAYFTWDVNLFDLVASGADFHGNNAKIFFDLDCNVSEVKELYPHERKMAKEVGLSLLYGAGSGRLQETAQKYGYMWSRGRCQQVLERYKEAYSGVYQYRDEVLNPALSAGQAIPNLFGRNFLIDDFFNVHMQGFNTLIQGSASDLVLNSAERIDKEFRARDIDGHVLLLVHDEIVTEVPIKREAECVEIITRSMTDYELKMPLGLVPLAVEGKVAERWEK